MKCTYRRCKNRPKHRVDSPNGGRPWLACDEHLAGMRDAFAIGCASDLGATVTPLAGVA